MKTPTKNQNMGRSRKMSEGDKKIYSDFEFCGQNAKKWMNKCVMMLPEIENRRIWEKKGFSCIYEFVAKLAGMSRDKVNEGLRIMGRVEKLPELRKVVEKKGIWAVRPVLRVADEKSDSFWAEKAKIMSKGALETYVRDAVNFRDNDSQPCENGRPGTVKNDWEVEGKPNQVQKIEIKVSVEMAEKLEKLKGDGEWEELMEEFVEWKELEKARKEVERAEQLDGLKKEIEMEKQVWRKGASVSRHIPVKIQRYVELRAGGKCEAPGCKKGGCELHHTYPFALKREHDPDKIRLLCEQHHQIAHQGLIDDTGSPEKWKLLKSPDILDFRSVINSRIAEFGFS